MLWADQPPSLLELGARAEQAPPMAEQPPGGGDGAGDWSHEDFGWVPSCCDVGYTRNEEGEDLPCDYSG